MDILSFHSRVVWGYVGNSIAVPVIQYFGLNAWPVDTVTLGHHPGHGPSFKRVATSDEISTLGRQAIQRMAPNSAVLIGYLGNADQGHAIAEIIHEAKPSEINLPVYLDPVFGDDKEGDYVTDDIVTFYKDIAVPMADVVMPNRYELSRLTDMQISSIPDAKAAALALLERGPEVVLVSSVPGKEGMIANVLVTSSKAIAISCPLVALKAKGTGDMLSAAFTSLHMCEKSVQQLTHSAISFVQKAVNKASSEKCVELDIPHVLAVKPITIDDLHIDEL